MRKEPPPSSHTSTTTTTTTTTFGKLFVCVETKLLVATLLSFTLVMFLWHLPPYYQNFVSTARPCTAPLTTSVAVSAVANTTATSLLSTNVSLPYTAKPIAKKYNSVPKPKPRDPNRRVFEAYGNAAALFVQMGAYRGGPTTFAVVGLASKPVHVFGKPWFKCEWISNNGSSYRSKAYKMLPDWGYGRVYTVVVVNCTFPFNPNQDNTGGKLMVNAYYGESQKKYEKFMALEESPGSYNESKFQPPYQYEYLYCGSSLYGNLSADRIREWMAYHAWFFGPSSHFVFHDAGGVSPDVMAVLKPWVRAGRATVQDIRDQAEYDGQWGFEKLLFRDSRTKIRRDRKYAIQAKNAYSAGVHMSENVIGKTLHNTETKIRYYHYHNTITHHGELCREYLPDTAKTNVNWFNKLPYVYDDNMKKLANTIKEFELKTIGKKPEALTNNDLIDPIQMDSAQN
ncbi:hypothetical protein F3Y22_tig00111303pilonHSYRG00052 [Hibiscus syriacus]|uniref:Glycosyltransferase family 92 protein n=1 Tax=Hibiscus syriacus TaxID=106335 RepID=A0A6A2YR44_HIBSY|nr:hypothetical protein F3Y22_tig00111303pilonHSYRG00052 [Hibiscus syriacus]